MKYGFAVKDSDLAIQSKALNEYGCDFIQKDIELKSVITQLNNGDELVVWRVDKLAESIDQLKEALSAVESRGASVSFLFEGVNTRSDCNKWFSQLIDFLSSLERH
ncbi:recombinase family protein [Vibrio fluvialis]|uniref:recombinase family protein n=1 Tax=Vibrio fluvialis TaxID=676 RepID=UPI00399C0094